MQRQCWNRLGLPATYARAAEAVGERTATVGMSLLAAVAVFFLFRVFAMCRHGLDFTDEGYYLNSIADPWLYRSTVTQFGLVYHPIFKLAGEDVALLRQFNVGLTWLLALAVGWFCIRGESKNCHSLLFKVAVAVCIATASLLYLSLAWIPTPSYNSLTLQGLLLAALGLVIAHCCQSTGVSPRRFAAALIGLGGAIVFLAKPTSAILLATFISPTALFVFRRNLLALSIAPATAVAVLLVTAYILDGGVSSFVARYQRGMEYSSLIAPNMSFGRMLRFESLGVPIGHLCGMWMAGGLALTALLAAEAKGHIFATWFLSLSVIASVLATIGLIATPSLLDFLPQTSTFSYFNVGLGPVLLGVSAFAILHRGPRLAGQKGTASLLLASFLLVCPYLFAFGTGHNVTTQALASVVFWPLAVAVLVRRALSENVQRHAFLVVAIVVVPATVWLVSSSMDRPYRQNLALHRQVEPVQVGQSSAILLVDSETANYIKAVRAALAGGSKRPPMFDFTGAHPGALFAVGAKAISLPWIIGGYPGSTAFVDRAVRDVPCDVVARAWLLTSPTAPRAISEPLLARHGFDKRRPIAGSFTGPWLENRSIQHLMSPPEDTAAAVNDCASRR